MTKSKGRIGIAIEIAAALGVGVITCLMVGCERPERPSSPQLTQHGDTLSILTPSEPQRPDLVLEEVLRIGDVDGSIETSFGRLSDLAIAPAGEIAIYDEFQNRISLFSRQGRFVTQVGRPGNGPGEFEAVLGLVFSADGSIVVATTRHRVLWFGRSGTLVRDVSAPGRLAAVAPVSRGSDGRIVAKIVEESGLDDGPTHYGFFAFEENAEEWLRVGVTVGTPWDSEVTPGQGLVSIKKMSRWHPSGGVIEAVSGRLAFQIATPDSVIRVESTFDPVPFRSDERADWEAQNILLRERSQRPEAFPPVPEFKPAFGDILIAESGEIWLRRRTSTVGPDTSQPELIMGLRPTPVWLEPILLHSYSSSGDFLTRVTGPVSAQPKVVKGDTIWGFVRGHLGEEYVVRWHLRTADVPIS